MKKYIFIFALLLANATLFASQPVKQKVKKEKVDTVAVIKEKAEKGDAAAQNTLGVWYYTGKGNIKQDYKEALKWWALSAKQDNPDAIGNMALCYQLGRGTQKDSLMAANLYEVAIKKGNKNIIPQHEAIVKNTGSIFSCLLLQECYQKGIGVEKNVKKANEYLEKAANEKHLPSQYTLALNYLNGKQEAKAVEWFKKAARQRHVGATYYYGYLLYYGKGITANQEEGIKFLKIAANKDFTMANYQLGKIYSDKKDEKTAFSYLKKAAEKGNNDAKWLLGNCYLNGKGVPQNYYFAAQWLAEAYNTHKEEFDKLIKDSKNAVFVTYLNGLQEYYLDKDIPSAITFFTKVDKAKNPEGKTMLGVCYGSKDYTKRNEKKAFKTLLKAASTSAVANYYLSSMYETGTGVLQDKEKALELLKKSADAKIAFAQCKLGDKYMTGNGVDKDHTKAALLYLDAEGQNLLTPESAKNLAKCYKEKLSVLPDVKNAEKRIDALSKQKPNNNLINMLRVIKPYL